MGTVESSAGLLGEAGIQDADEVGRYLQCRVQLRGLVLEDRVHRLDGALAAERWTACEHLPEDDTQAEEVAAGIHHPALQLLRAQVARSAHYRPGRAHEGLRLHLAARNLGPQLRQTEVQHLHPPILGDEDVLGFEIPVDDALFVGRSEPTGDLQSDLDGLPGSQRPAAQPLPERLALQQFHHQVGRSLVCPEVENGEDVRMGERRQGAGLLLEAGQAVRVRAEGLRQHLQRHLPAQLRVLRPVHLAHPPRTQEGEDFVGAKADP